MRAEVRLAGFGGQGVISAGMIAGRAIALHDHMNAVLTQAYGPEARGGACHANLIVSDERITFPKVTCPNLLILMSQEAYGLFAADLAPEGTMIVDEDLVETDQIRPDVHFYSIPATRIAEELGNKIVANVVILGAVAALVDYVHRDTLLQAVKESVPARFIDLNETAFEAGFETAKEMLS